MDATRHRLVQRRGWDRASTSYARYWQRQLLPAQELLLSAAGLHAGDVVIDVACGSGEMTMAVARAVAPGGRVLATDLSPKMVQATAALAADVGMVDVTTRCCDAEALDVHERFDVALCSLGLMYVSDPSLAVRELDRVVRPGGRVAVSVWGDRARCGWAGVFEIVAARVVSDVCPRFFALGTSGTLTGLLSRAGFVDVDETRLCVDLVYRDDAEAIGAAFLGGPVALAYAHFDTTTRDDVAREYLATLRAFRDADGGYRVPGEFVVASARRPTTA